MSAVVRRQVLVSGRVQGVFFRDACQREASRAGVGGWVANRRDGRVEAVFEGSLEAVERLVAWCRTGPPTARVDAIEVIEEDPQGEMAFRVSAAR
ncbi:MAG TPA: acylphosphatase [Acidimicrobiia bacterium]